MNSKLRSRSGKIMAVAGIAFSALGVTSLAIDSLSAVTQSVWIYLWFGYFSWLLFWNPGVTVQPDGVRVDNIFREYFVSWGAIRRIDTKYTLSLETAARNIRAFGAPAPSRYSSLLASRTEAEHLPESSFVGRGLVRPGDLTSSDSGVAAYVIRAEWERRRDRGDIGEVIETIEIKWLRVILFTLLSAAAVASFIF